MPLAIPLQEHQAREAAGDFASEERSRGAFTRPVNVPQPRESGALTLATKSPLLLLYFVHDT